MTLEELYREIGGSYERAISVLRVEKLVDKHIRKLPANGVVDRVIAAKAGMDATELFESAHAMKGVCGNLGLDELAAAASKVTEEFRPGNTPALSKEELDAHMQQLRDRYEQTVETIRSFAAEQG